MIPHNTETFFKFVGIVDGRYYSLYDGETEYRLGELMQEEARAGHQGGIYVCRSLKALLEMGPLAKCRLRAADWAVVRIIGWGKIIECNEIKQAISNAVPVEFTPIPRKLKERIVKRMDNMSQNKKKREESVFEDWKELLRTIAIHQEQRQPL